MKELVRNILKEESEDIDQKVYNFLRRRYEINEINIDDNIKFKELYFKVDDEYYNVSMWDNKKRQVRLIRQKVVRTIKKFLYEVM